MCRGAAPLRPSLPGRPDLPRSGFSANLVLCASALSFSSPYLPPPTPTPPAAIFFRLSTVNSLRPSLHLNILKPNPPQQSANRRSPVLRRHRQNPVLQRRLRQLPLRFLPHFALQKRIGRRKQPGLPRINPRLRIVQTRRKNLRRRQLDRN